MYKSTKPYRSAKTVNNSTGLKNLAKMPFRTFRLELNLKTLLVLFVTISLTLSDKHQVNRSNNFNRKHYPSDFQNTGEFSMPQTSGCGSCKMREDLKTRNIEAIKREVLNKMGFASVPNITGRVLPPVPAHVLARFEPDISGMQSDQPSVGLSITEEVDEYHMKTEQVLSFAQPYPRLRHSWRGHDILHFTFSDSITKYHVANASLYIYVKGADRKPSPDVLIEIFKIFKIPDHPESPGRHRVYSRKIAQPTGRGDWVKIDFTVTVSEWFKNPRENYGFIVNATVNGKKVVITDTTLDNGNKSPYVEITTMESKRRFRRNVPSFNCHEGSDEKICCRYPLTVNFEDFGWDFIIAPKKYDANYCSGECQMLSQQKYPHTHLATLATSAGLGQPCCTARKLSPITMLYFDAELNVVLGNLPGMVVDRCGCS